MALNPPRNDANLAGSTPEISMGIQFLRFLFYGPSGRFSLGINREFLEGLLA